jgi:hypothetical protein
VFAPRGKVHLNGQSSRLGAKFEPSLSFKKTALSWFLDTKLSVRGKHVLVVGSEVPWFEAILLSKGARLITTFDYVKIVSQHPQVINCAI